MDLLTYPDNQGSPKVYFLIFKYKKDPLNLTSRTL